MFRTKKDVERHVSDVLSKINNENEKNLRGYTFARLYFQVKDFEAARKSLSGFLSVRDHHAPAHKLMAQLYEVTNSFENALQSYKRSLEIDAHQNDIVLKICELYCHLPVDHETAKYWADRAEQIYPHNEIIFKLRECLVSAEGDPDHHELETLIATELEAQPRNIDLRIKLLRLYLDTERIKEAYEHATLIESKQLFPSSNDWYYMLADIFEAYQEEMKEENLDSQFYIHYLTALDHLIFLNFSKPNWNDNVNKSYSLNDVADVLFVFDKYMKKASEKDIKEGYWTYFMHHMKGQLFYHMSSILLKKAKMDQGNRKEALRFSAGLSLVCYAIKPMNLLQEMWFSQLTENQKLFTNFFQQASIRTSFIGHVIKNMCKEDKSKWLQKIKSDVCISQIKERIFNRIFSTVVLKKELSSSYFIKNDTFENCSLEFPIENSLKEYDKSSYKLCTASLHHLVWLEYHRRSNHLRECFLSEMFKGLQYSNKNLSKGSCESLCVLDLEAFLCASVYQAEADIERKKALYNNWNQDLHLSCPPNIADAMCSKQHGEWWKTAHDLHTCTIKEKLGEARRILQHGLEIIKGIGNHGMELKLVVRLARYFAEKSEFLLKDIENHNEGKKKILPENITALQLRATHYWNIALSIADKLISGNGVKVPKEPMFTGYNKILSKTEIRTIQEDGKLYLAVQLMEADKLNEAADILSELSSPYGSFYLALTLKKFASQEEKFSATRKVFLTKAKSSIHDTMDRIKDDPGHPLNKEIHIVLEDIEHELGSDHSISNGNNNDDVDEVDAYDSSALNSSVYTTPNSFQMNSHSTPKPSSKFMPQLSNHKSQTHFEPSPERLDAQIRALALNQDTVIKTIMEQNKSLLETNKSIVDYLQRNHEVLSDLKKQLEELHISDSRTHPKGASKKTSYLKGQGDEEYENFDSNALLEYYEENNEEYRAQGYSYNTPSHMMQDAAASLNYVVPPGPPPPLAHYNYQYPPHAMLPTAPVPERRPFYPPTGQSLPFSEGQQLPQFHFHVASPVIKPPAPMLSNVPSIQHAVTLPPPPPPPPMSMQQPPSLEQPSSGALPMTSPWTKPVGVPHAFQIPLPTSIPFVSASSLISQPASVVSSNSVVTSQTTFKNLLMTPSSGNVSFSQNLPNSSIVPSSASPNVSLFSEIAKTPEQLNRSRCDSENAEADGHDVEREVMGDFKPLIPLPDEVVVETGEEQENVLFEDRAKLYRFVDQEWKERGIGIVKILDHEESKRVRLLMRRDQVLKVCANHYITSNMEVKPLKTSDRAWTWVAQDFADEELKPEQFCIRFKTSEVALAFKAAFEKAINIVKDSESNIMTSPNKLTAVTSSGTYKPFGSRFLQKSGSWSCPTCYISNSSDKQFCEACETKKPGYTAAISAIDSTPPSASVTLSPASTFSFKLPTADGTPKSVFGGFTFSSSPTISEIAEPDAKDREILVVSTKSKNGPQVTKVTAPKTSPFSGFSFTSPQATIQSSTGLESFGSNAEISSANEIKPVALFKDFRFADPSTSVTTSQDSSISGGSITSKVDSKPSQFQGFSFKAPIFSPSTSSPINPLNTSDTNSKVSMSKIQPLQNIKPAFVFNSKDSPSISTSDKSSDLGGSLTFSPITTNNHMFSKCSSDGAPEDFIPTADFKPVVPLPALVDLKTGEEDEEKVFAERAKLFRYDSETKEWKERGTGELKILYLKDSQKYRILMRRDQVLKICANHYILPGMKLTPLSSSDRSWVWFAQDFSDGDLIQEKFAAKFKTFEIAKQFSQIFEKCQSEVNVLEQESPQIDLCTGNKDAFDKLLKPAPNSWQCSKCHKTNSNQSSCVYCKAKVQSDNSKLVQKIDQKPLSELFKPAVDSWECSACYVRNKSSDFKCSACDSIKPTAAITSSSSSKEGPIAINNSKPLSDLFKPPTGSWVCKACMVRNAVDKNKCASCETDKPGSTVISTTGEASNILSKFKFNPVSSTPAFSFGSSTTSSDGFIFGPKPSVQPSTFTFGQSALTKSDQVIGFNPTLPATDVPAIFGGISQNPNTVEKPNVSIQPLTVAPTFVFGSSGNTNLSFDSFSSPTESESIEFRFGSPQKYEFNFSGVRPHSPTKTPKSPRSPATPSDVEEEDEVEASDADNIYFTPVIPLPPKVDVKTGEEGERLLFSKRAKLYRFIEGEWKERGLGDIKILYDEKSKRTRLLMRREQVLKVCLNHYLTKEIKFDWRGDKSLTWAATDFSENEAAPELFAIRFKGPELAQEFKQAIDDALNVVDEQKSPESSSTDKLKNFSFKLDSSQKVESNFATGSLSSRFGTSQQGKSTFGNLTESNDTTKSTGFSFTLKSNASGFFGQTSFGSIGAPDGEKFGFSFNSKAKEAEDPEDVEIVYEAVPTPDQIAAAEKLQLPKTFYLFENKEPCPGCIGCTDRIPPYKGEVSETKQEELIKEPVAETPTVENSGEKLLFCNTDAVSFTDLASKSSFPSFAPPSSGGKTTFAGAGTPLFANLNTSGDAGGGDDTVPENPDIHFEPIIPLPDLIEVKTGEEDESPIFVHRAKLFRFDGSTKQWKERGIGDIKILRHNAKTRFRIILRRDQVHNIACNHCITEDMSLAPLSTSENAVCWNALDYSDGQGEGSKFAVRFKAKDALVQFKKVFEECVETVKESPKESPVKALQTDTSTLDSQKETNNHLERNTNNEEQQNSDEISEEDLIYEKRISFEIFDDEADEFKSVGIGNLLVSYDDTVYGYRVKVVNDKSDVICDHVIAIQNCLRLDKKKAYWSAIDISVNPPKRRQFRANFSSVDAAKEFNVCFEEGKETAVISGIVENETFSG